MNGQLVDQQPIELQELVKSCQLPALPQTAISLMRLAQDPENGPEEFAAPIEADPGLASQVLKFVNSSYFGFSGEISAVKMAITLVGIRTIQNFALWSAVFNLMPNPKCGSLEVKKLWQDSLRRALFARLFAKDRKCAPKDAEEIFAAALLQDLAIPLLAKELPEAYEQMFSKRAEGVRLSDLEQERFGWTHAEAAEVVAAAWKLPDSLSSLIGGHLQPGEPGSNHVGRLAVWLSSLLPAGVDGAWPELPAFEAAYAEHASGSKPKPIAAMLEDVDKAFEDFAPVLQLSRPPQTLVDLYRTERGECGG